jgi:hypothetical protein
MNPKRLSPFPSGRPKRGLIEIEGVTYRRHPLSALLPDSDDGAIALLRESLRDIGQRVPIKLTCAGDVLDGWTRLELCKELGLKPLFETISDDADLSKEVIACNLAHRHLTVGQRAWLAVKLSSYLQGGTRKNAGRYTDEGNQVRNSVLDFSTQSENKQIDDDPVSVTSSSTGQDAAKLLNVSRDSVTVAMRVAKTATPEVQDALSKGSISLNRAEVIAKQPKATQSDHLRERLKQGAESLKRLKADPNLEQKKALDHIRAKFTLPEDCSPAASQAALQSICVSLMSQLHGLSAMLKDGAFTSEAATGARQLEDACRHYSASFATSNLAQAQGKELRVV